MCVCFCSHLFWRQSTPFGVCLTYRAGFEKKRKMSIFANSLKFENEAHVHLGYINLKMRHTLGTSFENDAHLGHIDLRMIPTLGTSRPQSCFFLAHLGHIGPQRQVLYSASTSVNSLFCRSVFFCGHLQKFPTEICSFLFFWSPIAVGLRGMFPIYFILFPLCHVQKVKSALQHAVLAPRRSGPVLFSWRCLGAFTYIFFTRP